MAAPQYRDVTADHPEVHNTSPQHSVESNSDPALDISHEHHHAHLHHDKQAMQGREDEVVYSEGTTFERSTIPDQDPLDHALHRRHHPDENKTHVEVRDAEKGLISPIVSEEDPRTHTLSRFYGKWKVIVHALIWILFTGCVPSHRCFSC